MTEKDVLINGILKLPNKLVSGFSIPVVPRIMIGYTIPANEVSDHHRTYTFPGDVLRTLSDIC